MLAVACGLLTASGLVAADAEDTEPIVAQVNDPRAYGHRVGDVLTRTIVLDVPGRLTLDEASIPTPGREPSPSGPEAFFVETHEERKDLVT